jgi:hypothetical protein
MTVRFGGVSNTDPNHMKNTSAAWVMIHNNPAASGYAQSGHIRWYGSATYPFSQYSKFQTGTDVFTNIGSGALTIGSTYEATVELALGSSNCGGTLQHCLKTWFNGTLLQSTPWDPKTVWGNPWELQIYGEVKHTESDMPGGTTDHEDWHFIQNQNYYDNTWSYTFPTEGKQQGSDSTRWTYSAWSSCGGSPCTSIWTP